MPKLTLVANPTFTAKVEIENADGEVCDSIFTFRHRTKTGLEEFMKTRSDFSDIDSFMDMVIGWDLPEEFNRESAETLLENHISVAFAAYLTYIDRLFAAKQKN